MNEDCPEAAVPVGTRCLRCHVHVTGEDRGMMMPLMAAGQGPGVTYVTHLPETGAHPWVSYHLACQMEEVLGPRWRELLTEWGQTIET